MIEIYTSIALNLLIFAIIGWIYSLVSKNVTHVDSMWSLFFLIAYATGYILAPERTDTQIAVLTALILWSLRLSAHLTVRNWGKPEDIRYQNIRANNEPNFKWKSLYIIFILQAILAFVIAVPIINVTQDNQSYSLYTQVGLGIFLLGFVIEIVADRQLGSFLAKNAKKQVLNQGLWRYSRHPNYFGECLIWWGLYVVAIPSSSLFAIISPVLMTLLLVKISGADLMESTIKKRRPDYAKYVKTTSKFIPWPPKNS